MVAAGNRGHQRARGIDSAAANPYVRRVPRFGWSRLPVVIVVISLALQLAGAVPSAATMYPASLRLALVFERPAWQGPQSRESSFPAPGHVLVGWER